MTNDETINRIRRWQGNGFVHPLTCGNDSSHAKLEPAEKDGNVILKCRDCDYEQIYIPGVVMDLPENYNPFKR